MNAVTLTLKKEDVDEMVKAFVEERLGYSYEDFSVVYLGNNMSNFEGLTFYGTKGDKTRSPEENARRIAKKLNP